MAPRRPPAPPATPLQAQPRDALDQDLLALLTVNARESSADLARKLGVARTTVVARMARLQRDGIVSGYAVRLRHDLAQQGLSAFVGITVQPRSGADVARLLQRVPEVKQLDSVSGQFDYVALLRAESAERLDALLDQIRALDGVLQTTTSVVLSRRIDRVGTAAPPGRGTSPRAPHRPGLIWSIFGAEGDKEVAMPSTNEVMLRGTRRGLLLVVLGSLWGCASPPPPPPPPPPAPPEPEVRNRLRFEDSPEGARAILPDAILFETGKSDLSPEAGPVLDLLKPAFAKARGKIIIEGHTDSVGSDAFNKRLSLDRAASVRASIVALQVPPNRLEVRGLGKDKPRRSPETSDEDRQANRRAEILFPGETVDSLGGREIEELSKALARAQQQRKGG